MNTITQSIENKIETALDAQLEYVESLEYAQDLGYMVYESEAGTKLNDFIDFCIYHDITNNKNTISLVFDRIFEYSLFENECLHQFASINKNHFSLTSFNIAEVNIEITLKELHPRLTKKR